MLVLAGAFQSQAHQDGLEEQANCALAVVVKAESILVLDELAAPDSQTTVSSSTGTQSGT